MPTYLMVLGFIVFMSVLIAGYFYLEWAKARDRVAAAIDDRSQPAKERPTDG